MNITRSINKALQRLGALLTMTTLAACGGGSNDETGCPALVAIATAGVWLPGYRYRNIAASAAAPGQSATAEFSAAAPVTAEQQHREDEFPRRVRAEQHAR